MSRSPSWSIPPFPWALVALGCVLALLGGCEEEVGCHLSDPDTAWIELAEGVRAYEPIDDGRVLEVERGSQGGMHVVPTARLGGVNPGSARFEDGLRNGDLPWVSFHLMDGDGELTLDNRAARLLERGDGYYELAPRNVQFRHFAALPDNWTELDYDEVEADMELREFRLRVVFEDSCGLQVQDERAVRLDFPERPTSS